METHWSGLINNIQHIANVLFYIYILFFIIVFFKQREIDAY